MIDGDWDAFAECYDRYWVGRFSAAAAGLTTRLLLPHVADGGAVLDVCCGTGVLAAAVGARGYRVVGIDRARAMLRLARGRAPRALLVHADARAFALARPATAAVSTFDSLNSIATDELHLVFRSVHGALACGARFLFDVNSDRAPGVRWEGWYGHADGEWAYVVRARFDGATRRGRNDVTIFRRRPTVDGAGGCWMRSDVVLHQQFHPEADVHGALAATGFADVVAYDAERDLAMHGEAGRLVVVARKR